jgi:putative ABC transport system substrate-binding protein
MAELNNLHVDVLVVVATPATRAAKAATSTIPIVMLAVSDPVGRGLVASLAPPGGNLTGMADFSTDLIPKKLELLKTAAPKISRVALVYQDDARYYDAATSNVLGQRHDAAARDLGIKYRASHIE